jgi:hypothetical protein
MRRESRRRSVVSVTAMIVGATLAGYSFGGGIDNVVRAIQGGSFTVSAAGAGLGLGIGLFTTGLALSDTRRLPGLFTDTPEGGSPEDGQLA